MLVEIPLLKQPNQDISITLNNQPCLLKLYTRGEYMFMDLYINGIIIFAGQICVNGSYINQYISSFNGYLFFFNDNENNPQYSDIGNTVHLLYADYDVLANYFDKWVINDYQLPISDIELDINDLQSGINTPFNIIVTYYSGDTAINPDNIIVSVNRNEAILTNNGNGYSIITANNLITQVEITLTNRVFTKIINLPVI